MKKTTNFLAVVSAALLFVSYASQVNAEVGVTQAVLPAQGYVIPELTPDEAQLARTSLNIPCSGGQSLMFELRNQLNLPSVTERNGFYDLSGITPTDLNRAIAAGTGWRCFGGTGGGGSGGGGGGGAGAGVIVGVALVAIPVLIAGNKDKQGENSESLSFTQKKHSNLGWGLSIEAQMTDFWSYKTFMQTPARLGEYNYESGFWLRW